MRPLGRVLLPALLTRVVLALFAYGGLIAKRTPPGGWRLFPENRFLDGWLRWDSGFYLGIASSGYGPNPGAAFFPLYPYLGRFLATPLSLFFSKEQAIGISLLLLSELSFFVAVVGLYRLGRMRLDRDHALRAVWLLSLYPFSLFFSAAYTESLYLAVSVWAFYFASKDRWLLAALLASLCCVARIPGLMVPVALVVEYMRRRSFRLRQIRWTIIPLLASPLTFVLHMFHLYRLTGDPLYALHIRASVWSKPPGFANVEREIAYLFASGRLIARWARFAHPKNVALTVGYGNLVALVGGLILVVVCFKRIGIAQGVLAAGALLATMLNGLEGTGRVVGTAFPVFLAAAAVLPRWAFSACCLLFVPFLLLYTFYFTHWLHVT